VDAVDMAFEELFECAAIATGRARRELVVAVRQP